LFLIEFTDTTFQKLLPFARYRAVTKPRSLFFITL